MTSKLSSLHERPDLLDKAAHLLITEWPRSLEARKASIQTSKGDLPCSILLVDVSNQDDQKVIGFARLLKVVGDTKAALVESVVVDRTLRGCGLGRKIMEACENHVTGLGMWSLHLSTHDKQQFYSHLGYRDGPIVSGVRHSAKAIQESLVSVVASAENVNDNINQEESTVVSEVVPPPPSSAPPPPVPPPPPKLPVASSNSTLNMTWMVKYFDQNLT